MDNDALVLGALQYVVRTYLPQSEVIWKETDGNRAVSLCSAPATTPDALIVDASLEGMTGSEVCRRIRTNDTEIVLVGVTSFILDRFHDAMMDSGAQCLLPKDRPQDICQAVMALCECRIPNDARFSTESADEAHRRLSEEQQVNPVRVVMLSPREEEVMTWIDLGKSSSWIAKRLNTSESTIKTYAQRIYTKLGVRTQVEAIIAWSNRRGE
ncbi:LuxR C-terminal-related transcriptional regulator [Bifidobacterium pseudolongum]|uniref:response regulator transcription factor n=1 Tax=Bifidobacterium pseudolongum TaxID=1694 RepID=UPI003F8E0568